MTAVIHYGKDSERHLKLFAEKRAEHALQGLREWQAKELKTLLQAIRADAAELVPAA